MAEPCEFAYEIDFNCYRCLVQAPDSEMRPCQKALVEELGLKKARQSEYECRQAEAAHA